MRNRRWGDNDRHFWPFTLSGPSCHRPIGVMLDSGAHEDCRGGCHVRFSAFGWTLICELPRIVKDYRERHQAQWDAETVARIGRTWYESVYPREYGFHFSEGALHVHYGAQTHSSDTTQSKCYFLPWKAWRHVRRSLYDTKGNHFWTECERPRNSWEAGRAVEDACPKLQFDFEDYDGERITATTHIEEREWRWGERPFRWLSWFRRPRISRSLLLSFSSEVGKEKGSWKGGTVGHSIEMLPGELHRAAFMRYCSQEHRSKNGRFRLRYLGAAETVDVRQERTMGKSGLDIALAHAEALEDEVKRLREKCDYYSTKYLRLRNDNAGLRGLLRDVVAVARTAQAHWDADRDSKVGKILIALSGGLPGYDARIDAMHAALAGTAVQPSDALEKFARDLAAAQTPLDPTAAKVLRENLHDLYMDGGTADNSAAPASTSEGPA